MDAPPAPTTVCARQPIWTPAGTVHGHEYLYRTPSGLSPRVDHWHASRQDHATTRVLAALAAMRARRTPPAGARRAFVNITRSFVVGDLPLPEPSDDLVLEVVESVPADREVLRGLDRLHRAGHRLAIDDFTGARDQAAMLPFADYVKVDVRDLQRGGVALARLAGSHGATLVAEHVADRASIRLGLEHGFHLLQGDALAATSLVTQRGPSLVPHRVTDPLRAP